MAARLTSGLKDACTLSLPPGELFFFSSPLFPCIRPSLSTRVHLASLQTALRPLESNPNPNPNPSASAAADCSRLLRCQKPDKRLHAPTPASSEPFLWLGLGLCEGISSCQHREEPWHRCREPCEGPGTRPAALGLARVPQRGHHNTTTESAQWRSEGGI